jgi:hypothetical protein
MIVGLALARSELPAFRRAFRAADLVTGQLRLVNPTVRQASAVCEVSAPYTYAALRVTDRDLRAAIEAGRKPLISTSNRRQKPETLAAHFARSTTDEWLEAARVIGPAIVWDRMIAPLV